MLGNFGNSADQVQAARLRGEVCLDGYLQKTGSKKKGSV